VFAGFAGCLLLGGATTVPERDKSFCPFLPKSERHTRSPRSRSRRFVVSSHPEGHELGAMTVKEFCRKYGIGTTKFYEEVKAGRLRAVKCGTRTLVLNRDSIALERTLSAISAPQSATA